MSKSLELKPVPGFLPRMRDCPFPPEAVYRFMQCLAEQEATEVDRFMHVHDSIKACGLVKDEHRSR